MTRDSRIAYIINRLGELRELLLVIEQAGDAAPGILLKLAKEKAEEIDRSTRDLRSPHFWEELQNHIAANYEQISRLYQRHDMGSYSDIPLFIEGNGYKGYDAAYAAQIYNFTFNLNKEADTRIEYMYKNNKSYDYRI